MTYITRTRLTWIRLTRPLIAALLVAAGAVAAHAVARPTAAWAANGPCWDQVKDTPTPVRAGPGGGYRILEWKRAGQQVTGPCWVYARGGTYWYMVNDIHNYWNAGPYGTEYAFIWAPHLRYWYTTGGDCYYYQHSFPCHLVS